MVREHERALLTLGVYVWVPGRRSLQTHTHRETGLSAACVSDGARSHRDVRTAVLAYVLDRIPDARVACLAGSTVHADKAFLKREMPEVRICGVTG